MLIKNIILPFWNTCLLTFYYVGYLVRQEAESLSLYEACHKADICCYLLKTVAVNKHFEY